MRVIRRVFAALFAATFALTAWSSAAGQAFQHPGVLVSRAQLDYIRTMVAAHNEPFYSAYLKAMNSNIG